MFFIGYRSAAFLSHRSIQCEKISGSWWILTHYAEPHLLKAEPNHIMSYRMAVVWKSIDGIKKFCPTQSVIKWVRHMHIFNQVSSSLLIPCSYPLCHTSIYIMRVIKIRIKPMASGASKAMAAQFDPKLISTSPYEGWCDNVGRSIRQLLGGHWTP